MEWFYYRVAQHLNLRAGGVVPPQNEEEVEEPYYEDLISRYVYFDDNCEDYVENMPKFMFVDEISLIGYNLENNLPKRDGFNFKYWNTEPDGSGTTYYPEELNNKLNEIVGDRNITLYAQWEISGQATDHRLYFDYEFNCYTIPSVQVSAESLNPSVEIEIYSDYVYYGAANGQLHVTFSWSNNEDYLVQIYENDMILEEVEDENSISLTWRMSNATPQQLTVDVKFYQKYVVTFNAQGGSCSTTSKVVMDSSEYGTLPTPTRTGYLFLGWYTSTTSLNKVTETTKVSSLGNHTLYAKWESKTITLTVRYHGGSSLQKNLTDLKIVANNCVISKHVVSNGENSTLRYTFNQNVFVPISVVFSATNSSHVYSIGTTIPTYSEEDVRNLPTFNTYTYSWSAGSKTIDIYAKEVNVIYYDQNGLSTRPMFFPYSYFTNGGSVKIQDTSNFFRVGYGRATGWSENADGTGRFYTSGQTYSVNESKVLYLKWDPAVSNVQVQIKTSTDGSTYENSALGGTAVVQYKNGSGSLKSATVSSSTLTTITTDALLEEEVTIVPNSKSGYVFVGITYNRNSNPSEIPPNSIEEPSKVFVPTEISGSTYTVNVFFKVLSDNQLKYDSTEKYWYFEHGEYPQSYVGTSMNNTLNSASPTKSGEIKYNDGTTNQKIEVYTYNSKRYARLQATSTQTLKMSDGTSYTFTKNNWYWFEVELIRWRVSDYGVSSTSYPTGWSTYGTYKTDFTVVSDRILTIGSVTKKYPQTNNILSSITSDYSVTGNNLTIKYKASDKSFTLTNSSTSDPYATINHTVNLVQGMKYRVYMDVTNSSGVNASSRSIQMFYAIDGAYSEANSIKLGGDGQWKTFVAQKTGTYKIRIDNDTGGTAIIKNFQIQEADIAESWEFSSSDMYNNISGLNESASTSNFSANITNKQSSTNYTYYKFGSAGQQDKVISDSVLEDGVRVASIEEIDDYLTDYFAKASDMVCFLLGCGTDDKVNYWTRNLGTGLGNGQIVTKAGITKSSWLDKVQGVRLALTMGNGSRI